MSAEQRRLNPMADEESKGGGAGGLTAEQRRLNPMAGGGGGSMSAE